MPKENQTNRFLLLLGLPSFGLTFAVTILTAFLPQVLTHLTSPLFIGLIIGAEGFLGIFAPVIFGFLSDRAHSVLGRFRYLVPATAAMAASLLLMGLIRNLYIIAPMVALFYAGYFAYLAPYWAIYPDLISKRQAARSRSFEGVLRVVGAFLALLSGGFLLTLWTPLPFVAAGGLVIWVTFVLLGAVLKKANRPIRRHVETMGESLRYLYAYLRRDANIRNLAIANTFWNASLQSIQAFVVIFFTQGLERSTHFVSGVIFPVAAIGVLGAAPFSARVAEKFGYGKSLSVATVIYGLGSLVAGFTQSYWVILLVPFVGAAATYVMVIPYAALMRLLGGDRHGAVSGLFGLSRGVGSFLGPLITGVAVTVAKPLFSGTHGYAVIWLVIGGFVLASLPFILRVKIPGENSHPAFVKLFTAQSMH